MVRGLLARPEGLEPPAYWFEASRSIHLSYGRLDLRLPQAGRADSGRIAGMAGQVLGGGSEANPDALGGDTQVGGKLLDCLSPQVAAVNVNGKRLEHLDLLESPGLLETLHA